MKSIKAQVKCQVDAVKSTVSLIEKQFGQGSIMMLTDDHRSSEIACHPSGSLALDAALGGKGYPRGRVIEIYGPESSGKTTLCLHAIAEVQQKGGITAFIDAEHALDMQYARRLGVKPEALLVSQPDNGEQALDICEALVKSGKVALVVVDSVAALVPRAEIEGEMGASHMGLQARLMSQALRKLAGLAYRTETTLMFINQLRMKIGVTYGSPETTTGGQALKYYASVRLDVRRIASLKDGDEAVGNRTKVKVVKNKIAPPFQTAELDIRYGDGIDAWGELIDLCTEKGIIDKNGSYYAFDGTTLGQGREKTRLTMQADPELVKKLKERLHQGPPPSDNLANEDAA